MEFGRRENPEHYSRLGEVSSASRRAVLALLAAVGFTAFGVYGRAWAFVPGALSAIFAVGDLLLVWRGYRAAEARDLTELLSGNPCRAARARAVEYGVDVETLPEGEAWSYVRRDFEDRLRVAILAALSGEGPRLVMLCGDTKSGKTRSAFQCLQWEELRDAWLVVPRDGSHVETLIRPGALPRSWTPLVIWLDDIERYASVDSGGLNEGSLRNLESDRPIVLLATAGGRAHRNSARTELLIDPVEQLRDLGECIDVPIEASPAEIKRASDLYGRELVSEIEQVGLGRRMVAISELRNVLRHSNQDCPEGFAVLRAAIDWRRAGSQRPLSVDRLGLLYGHYLPDNLDPSDELCAAGLAWAREPLPNSRVYLLRKVPDGGYEPYDLAVEVASEQWPALTAEALERIAERADPQDCFQMARGALDANENALALDLLARAERSDDRKLSAVSAFNTGVLLAETGDAAGAMVAYRRATERGSQRAAFNLGQLLRHGGDLTGAEAAYRKADERGSREGAVNLGVLLEQRGDSDGALAAYRRADQRGSRKGASNLGRLLAERNDLSEAEAAFGRAEERRRVTA